MTKPVINSLHLLARELKLRLAGQDKTTQTVLRILAALAGGYTLLLSTTMALVLLLPLPKADALFFTSLLPAILYPALLIWTFSGATAQFIWHRLLCATLGCTILIIIAVWLR